MLLQYNRQMTHLKHRIFHPYVNLKFLTIIGMHTTVIEVFSLCLFKMQSKTSPLFLRRCRSFSAIDLAILMESLIYFIDFRHRGLQSR